MRVVNRRPVGTILWDLRVLWLTAAVLILTDALLRPLVFKDRPSSLDPLIAQGASPDSAPVIIIGSSRFRRIKPAHLDAVEPRAHLVNLSFNGGTFAAQNALIKEFLTPEVLRAGKTQLVLLGSGPLDINDSYRNPVTVPHTWTAGTFFEHIMDYGTDTETRLFLFSQPPIAWSSLMTGYRRNRLRGDLRGLALRLTGQLKAKKKTPEPGDDVLANTSAKRAKGATTLADVPPPISSVYLRNWSIGGRQTEALRTIVTYLRAQNVAVAVVHAPVSSWYAEVYLNGEQAAYIDALKALSTELDLPVFLLPRDAFGLVDADYFRADGRFDGHHIIDPAARERFAQGIGRMVVKPLLDVLEARRRPGAALSRFELHP